MSTFPVNPRSLQYIYIYIYIYYIYIRICFHVFDCQYIYIYIMHVYINLNIRRPLLRKGLGLRQAWLHPRVPATWLGYPRSSPLAGARLSRRSCGVRPRPAPCQPFSVGSAVWAASLLEASEPVCQPSIQPSSQPAREATAKVAVNASSQWNTPQFAKKCEGDISSTRVDNETPEGHPQDIKLAVWCCSTAAHCFPPPPAVQPQVNQAEAVFHRGPTAVQPLFDCVPPPSVQPAVYGVQPRFNHVRWLSRCGRRTTFTTSGTLVSYGQEPLPRFNPLRG